ncbi:MAG: carbonic anhydrase [Nitratiruptor sp.]|nr:carbonic anhydrase [Nitratiruptor sp.]NPA83472.1 carbonic anhydrase family protein [Campylobacterota bacterium]
MQRLNRTLAALAFSLGALWAGGHGQWSYHGATGPSHWGDLDPNFLMCKIGSNQSPVNLHRFIQAQLPRLKVVYRGNAMEVLNDGHSVKVTTIGSNEIVVDGIPFNLVQFHFHTPSEHTLQGRSFPMEAHFVHQSPSGELLVVALFFEEGHYNKALEKILNDLDGHVGVKSHLKEMFNPGELFPRKLDYYRYSGSLTTPPCSEGVRWIVLKERVEASQDQIQRFQEVMGENNRPTQPLKARTILE